MNNKDKGFLANNTETTKATVLNREDKFVNLFGTLHHKLANNNTAAHVPVSQQVDTTLLYH